MTNYPLNATRFTFPYWDKDGDFLAIKVERERPDADEWAVTDGHSWWRRNTADGRSVDSDVPQGSFTSNRHQATLLPLIGATVLAEEIADRRRKRFEANGLRHETLIDRVRIVVPVQYREGMPDNPANGDVWITLTTNGTMASITGQVNIYIWPYEPGLAPEHTDAWRAVQADIFDAFERAGWCVTNNSYGIATWQLDEIGN